MPEGTFAKMLLCCIEPKFALLQQQDPTKIQQNKQGYLMTSDRARTRHTAVVPVAWKRLPLPPLL